MPDPVNTLLDERDRLVCKLGAADATIWRLRELLLEVAGLYDTVDLADFAWLRRAEKLNGEIHAVLKTVPDTVTIPTISATGPDGVGEAPDGPVAARRRTLADDVADGLHDRPHP